MENAIQKFHNLQKIAQSFSNEFKICMFLRERSFQAVWTYASSPEFPKQEKEKMSSLYSQFLSDKKSYNWDMSKIDKHYYEQFLEYFYKQNSFQHGTIESFTVCLHLTEELHVWGQLDKLSNDRIQYFHKKINNLQQQSQPVPSFGMESQRLLGFNKPNNFAKEQMNTNMQNDNGYQGGNFNVNRYQQNQNTYNNMSNQGTNMNMNSYTNMNMNNNYVCTSNSKYLDNFNSTELPRKVDPKFARKISKKDPLYKELKETIERYIEYANLELDYHNIHEAKERLEAVSYYISNITD